MIFLGILIAANMSFLKISLLIQHGDVETNPGPKYNIMKSVTGTCHQGDIAKFGKTAGRQCLCNAMYAIAWSIVKRIGLWSQHDLDLILTEGNQIYKAKNTPNYLTTEDLPGSVKINGNELTVFKLANYHGRLSQLEHFISNVHKNEENTGNGLILIFNGFSMSVIWNKAHFFLFDSHSRDSNGIPCENGTAVLLKFRSLLAIEKYLLEVYVKNIDSMLFDLQYIKLLSHNEVDFQLNNSVKTVKACKRKYMAANYNAFKSSEKYATKLEQNKRYKSKNYETILVKNNQYIAENYQNVLESNMQYKERNYENILEKNRQYKEENYETILEKNRQYMEENYETILEKNKEEYKEEL